MSTDTMTEGKPPRVTAVNTQDIDGRLPEGQILVEIWDDGEIHMAYRENTWDSWPLGMWGMMAATSNSDDPDALDLG